MSHASATTTNYTGNISNLLLYLLKYGFLPHLGQVKAILEPLLLALDPFFASAPLLAVQYTTRIVRRAKIQDHINDTEMPIVMQHDLIAGIGAEDRFPETDIRLKGCGPG